jgi:squalene-hopene/tetraprenyl-beta-curcumene cyclase
MKSGLLVALTTFIWVSVPLTGFADEAGSAVVEPATVEQPISPLPETLRREGEAAIGRAVQWLINRQQPEGNWSSPDFPALTALPLWALVKSGRVNDDVTTRATRYILSTYNENGSFCREPSVERKGGGLCNYNTALSMVALHATGNPEFVPMIQSARAYIAKTQHFGDDIYRGGMGYDPDTGRPYADLSNSYLAYEAMRLTENVEDLRRETSERADLDWDAARQFIERVQNRPESNDQAWASDDPADYGGFAYKPDSSMAGGYTNEAGEIRLRSYGSMTYAGLLSFIYASVDKNDPRVQSAYEWSRRNWNLEENPGMELQGLFYYYQTLSKALSAIGINIIALENGESINWRTELVKKLISLQKVDPDGTGFWVNSEGRWWEADPTLVTSYSLLAMIMALQ